jgi:hypothetical protein
MRPEFELLLGAVDDRSAAIALDWVFNGDPAGVEAADDAAARADDHEAPRVVDDERAVAGKLPHGKRTGGDAEADYEQDEYEAPHGAQVSIAIPWVKGLIGM